MLLEPTSVRTLDVPLFLSELVTCWGVSPELFARNLTTTPETCGEAMEVPLIVFVALDPIQVDVIEDPGAKISKQLPKFEYEAR